MKRHLHARSKHSQPLTSPNITPATKSVSSSFQRKLRELLPPMQDDSNTSEDDPRIKSSSRTRRFGDLTRPILETILYWKIQHFALRLSPKISPNAAPATKTHTPTSPNTAPATQNASYNWSTQHMKRHLQCAEQAQSASNLTKYYACHDFQRKLRELLPPIERRFEQIRRWSEDAPTIKSSFRTRRFGDLTRPILETILYWKYNISRSGYLPKCHQILAPATKPHTPTSPNTAPAIYSLYWF